MRCFPGCWETENRKTLLTLRVCTAKNQYCQYLCFNNVHGIALVSYVHLVYITLYTLI